MTEDTTTPAPSEPVAGPVQRPVGRLEPEREELRPPRPKAFHPRWHKTPNA